MIASRGSTITSLPGADIATPPVAVHARRTVPTGASGCREGIDPGNLPLAAVG